MNDLIKMAVRERIGRFKYTHEDELDVNFDKIMKEIDSEMADLLGKEDL